MRVKLVAVLVLAGLWAIASGQDKKLTQEQQIVLDNPEVISLQIAPVTRRRSAGVRENDVGPFIAQGKIRFALIATNTSIVPVVVRRWDQFAQNRPRLLRDNQEVPYRNHLRSLLKQKDEETGDIVSMMSITLEPNQEKILEYIDLSDWYAPLEPGHYDLSTQHRFVQGGKWVDAASIVFEVEKKQ